MVKKAKKKKAAAKKPLKRKTAMQAIPSFKGKYVWLNDLDQLWCPSNKLNPSPGEVYTSPNGIRPEGCAETFNPAPAQDYLGYKPHFNEQGEWVFEIVWADQAKTLRSALKAHKRTQADAIKTLETVRRGCLAKIRQAEKAALKWG